MVMENCPQRLPNHAEVVLVERSPVLVYQISSRATRVLVDIQRVMPKDVKQYMKDVVYPQMPGTSGACAGFFTRGAWANPGGSRGSDPPFWPTM